MGVNRLRCLHPAFDGFGNSAMTNEVGTKVRTGRPYGGTGFLYNKKHSKCIKPLVNYKHERVCVLKMTADCGDIILINAYLPYFNTRDLQNQRMLYQDTLSYVDYVISDNVGSHTILLLDMNCNIYDNTHPFSVLLRDLMNKFSLHSAFDLIDNFNPDTEFTRSDVKTGSYTLIDGILLSQSLLNLVSNVRISEYGDNVSDHRPVELELLISLSEIPSRPTTKPHTVNWSKLPEATIAHFRDTMTAQLDKIDVPFYTIIHGDKCCNDDSHKAMIETYYNDISAAVIAADSILPRTSPSVHKSYWSPTLSEFKLRSIDCCKNWRSNGSPKSGPIFQCKQRCSFEYKREIRIAKRDYEKSISDDLHHNLTALDNNSFWNIWRNKNRESDSLVTRVNGETDHGGIAEEFRKHFRRVYSNSNTPAHESLKNDFSIKFAEYHERNMNVSISPCLLSWDDMLIVMSKLKTGEASSGEIKPEHFLHGSTKLVLHLHLLFNGMLQHGIVVEDFLRGTITPIIKDTQGDISDTSNYRGITLGNLYSKLFEYALHLKMEPYLETDFLQFGFKRHTSTSHALFALKSTVDYFNDRGSDTFLAFLDCTKAIDCISHYGLFLKLMERNIPLCLLLIVIFWHLGMTCRVKWGNVYSHEFDVPLGTKQGGISSPGFFSVYINDLVKILRKSGVGCHMIRMFVGCILFADDLALMAPTRYALQQMIDICRTYCEKYCLQFNAAKSKAMIIGRSSKVVCSDITISGQPIEWVSEWKYLGTTISAGKRFSFSARPDITNFFRASNSVIHVLTDAHEHTLLTLLFTNCVPILTYACSIKEYSASEMSDCNVAMNNVIRKIFGFKDWRSIRTLREIFGFKSLYEVFKVAKDGFLSKCSHSPNPIIAHISSLTHQ